MSHPSQSYMKNIYLCSSKFHRIVSLSRLLLKLYCLSLGCPSGSLLREHGSPILWKTHILWASSFYLKSSSWDSYTPLASQYSGLEGNQNTFDAIQSRLPLSRMHQEVFSIIMFLQNKFHWEAFHHPECMGCSCNLKAWRVFFLSALLIFSTKMRKKTEKYLHQ